jgi:hypothetical protein
MRILALLSLGVCAFAQIERPRLGIMLDEKGDARPVYGVAASATLGNPVLRGVLALACRAGSCLAKTETALVTTAGDIVDAPAGPAVLGGAWIYFPLAGQLFEWRDRELRAIPFVADGEVLTLRPSGDGLDYAVTRDDGVWIEHLCLADGEVSLLGWFPAARAALLFDGGMLLAEDDAMEIWRADGSETVIPVAGVRSFIEMGDGSVELVTGDGMWMLDLGRGSTVLLPGGAP